MRGLDGAPEWPVIRSILPRVTGKRAADLGCGFGWVSRWMREQGAASVLGLDLSQNMLARAREATDAPAIEYRIADLETLVLPEAAFELIYSADQRRRAAGDHSILGIISLDKLVPGIQKGHDIDELADRHRIEVRHRHGGVERQPSLEA